MTDREACILLNAVPGIPPRTKHRLLEALGSPAAVVRASREALAEFVTEHTAERIAAFCTARDPETLRIEAESVGARLVALVDLEYPPLLRPLPDPPLALYIRGSLPEAPHVAVVGTRRPSADGMEVGRRLAADLAAAGVCVVSGLARGIDAAAHRGALEAGGLTVAVLGCGIDRIWPAEHGDLLEQVAEHGAVLSEYPPGTPPLRHHFPARNRILAALSRAVVVVEARERSGALLTAEFALDLGREVFAVPGCVLNPRSRGPHQLLREGAHLAESAEDVLSLLGIPPRAPRTAPPLREAEAALVALLEEPCHLDELVRATGQHPAAVAALLVALEVRGIVRRLAGGRYVRAG
ncbi:MAG: DNA-processing protein DprA [Armatimonadota bacterium]|nr:DNA-processing protein DprA [Armatimonadota bacterium]MDR7567828.1 DNA-processing protein DprA [Armatimonadota bacterium]MDR7601081.1 DNA-processing protein DprA [Armatimonadota bacterium]